MKIVKIVSVLWIITGFIVFLPLEVYGDIPFEPNIKINYNEEPTSEEEVTIAIHGTDILVGGWHYCLEDDATATTLTRCAVGYSHDGGTTWHNAIMDLPPGFADACDPAVCCNETGVFYYVQLGLEFDVSYETGVYLSRSDDSGVTWLSPVDVTSGSISTGLEDGGLTIHLLDKEWVAAEGTNVYVSFGDLRSLLGIFTIQGNIRFVRSTDSGATFNAVQTLNSTGLCNLSMPICDGTGNVYVFWRNFSDNKFYLAHSDDYGASFGTEIEISSIADPIEPDFRVMAMPIVEVNPVNHHLYLVWNNEGTGGDPSDIKFCYSTDEGSTWSTAIVVNDDGTGNGQWFPWIDIDGSGTAHVIWYDERNNTAASGEQLDLYYATFNEGDGTFSTNARVTNTTFDVVLPHEPDIASFIGDYIGVAYGSRPHPAWMDSRAGNQDVYSAGYTESLPERVQAIQVIDVSGSMGWASSVPGIDKLDAVKEDAHLFVGVLRDGTMGDPQDEMGMVQYSHDVIDFSAPGLPTVNYVPLTPMEASFGSDADDYIDNMTDHTSTSIARGLEKAQDEFDLNDPTDAARMILLLSDGHETVGPYVDENLINELLGRNVRCFALGYGTDPYIDEPLLSDIAHKTGGDYHYADSESPIDITKLYEDALAQILDGYIGSDPIETIAGGSSAKLYDVDLTEADHAATFILNWEHHETGRLSFKLRTPNGVEINPTMARRYPGMKFDESKTYQFYTIWFPLANDSTGHIGNWKLIVEPGLLPDGEIEKFATASIIRSNLRMDVSFDDHTYGTGDRIVLRAKLHQNGLPVTGSFVDDIVAVSNVPLNGLGNFLSTKKLNNAELQQMKILLKQNPDLTKKTAKLKILLQRKTGVDQFPRNEYTLPLYDDGLHDDFSAGDGIYGNAFTATQTPGTYTFNVMSKLRSLGGHSALRLKRSSVYTKVNINGQVSFANVVQTSVQDLAVGQSAYQITVVPKDHYGNYLGPGFSRKVQIKPTLGYLRGGILDRLDGSYSALLIAPEKRKVRITLNIDDVQLAKQPVAEKKIRKWPQSSLHIGAAIPFSDFTDSYEAGYNIILDVGYPISPRFSLIAQLGYNQFKSKTSGVSDTNIINVSMNVRYAILLDKLKPYIGGGIGFYRFKNGDNDMGINIGAGLSYQLQPKLSIELGGDFHVIFDEASTQFIHIHSGIVYVF